MATTTSIQNIPVSGLDYKLKAGPNYKFYRVIGFTPSEVQLIRLYDPEQVRGLCTEVQLFPLPPHRNGYFGQWDIYESDQLTEVPVEVWNNLPFERVRVGARNFKIIGKVLGNSLDDFSWFRYKTNPIQLTQVQFITPTESPTDSCSICLEAMKDGYISLSCGHIFHQECVTRWLSRHNICPLCRQ